MTAEKALEAIEQRADKMTPTIVLGDDESTELTPYQAGYLAGLRCAAKDIRAALAQQPRPGQEAVAWRQKFKSDPWTYHHAGWPYAENERAAGAIVEPLYATPAPAPAPSAEVLLREVRSLGWSVAVHNDSRLKGEQHTFWLFTKDGQAIKGEGRTDIEALAQVHALASPAPAKAAPASETEGDHG